MNIEKTGNFIKLGNLIINIDRIKAVRVRGDVEIQPPAGFEAEDGELKKAFVVEVILLEPVEPKFEYTITLFEQDAHDFLNQMVLDLSADYPELPMNFTSYAKSIYKKIEDPDDGDQDQSISLSDGIARANASADKTNDFSS